EHLLQMINEVLDFSKIEAGKLDLRLAPFPLTALLRDVAAAAATRAKAKQLDFRLDADPALPPHVVGDAQKLRQVLDNLLGNAIKFTARGTVTLAARIEPDSARIRFSLTDTGVGLSESDRLRLFEPFAQAVDARPPEPGTGLGLAISRRLVELMDGELQVDSTLGRGSTFAF